MSDDQQETFKVTDRRLFNPDGSPRDDAPEPQPEAIQPETIQLEPVQPAPVEPELVEPALEFEPASETGEEADSHEEGEPTEFMAVLMEVATPALIHLGMAEHPATGRPEINLPAGQQAIEMLRILREKTSGNLTREEEDYFEELLAVLRMRFVELNNQPSR